MSTQSTIDQFNVRELAAQIRGLLRRGSRYQQEQFWFSGDASTTDFEVQTGWKPLHVFDAGSLQKEGSGDEYEVAFDGHNYTVGFNVAPANGNDICVIGVVV